MLTKRILQAEIVQWEQKLSTTSQLPLAFFKGKTKATKLAQKCAMALAWTFPQKTQRLQALQIMFQLPYCPRSSYDLTLAQAYALRNVAYREGRISAEFIQFAEAIKEELED